MDSSPIQISSDNRHLTLEGKPFFYLADTLWNAFACATVEEWAEFTEYRGKQGFNYLQYSAMPVLHDASDTYIDEMPFKERVGGNWDFGRPSASYFNRAKELVEIGLEKGLRPCITVIWNNYLQDTWANKRRPDVFIPSEAVASYSAFIAETFAAYHPIYFISGDTSFDTDSVTNQYLNSLASVKNADPSALTAMHITGGTSGLPEHIAESGLLDLHIYQSGHNLEHQDNTYRFATEFYNSVVTRPVINSEPCYEGHGHGNRYGRFKEFDVRNAFWTSVLAGANAGFTYGAHGIWSWHREGAAFTSESWSLMPFDWRAAMQLPGSSDIGYSKTIFDTMDMRSLFPAQGLLNGCREQIRVSSSPGADLVVAYVPYSLDVTFDTKLSDHRFLCIDLSSRTEFEPKVALRGEGIRIAMAQTNADYLIIAKK